jgi:hypothetical protein
MHCDGVRGFTIKGVQNTKARIAQADCLFEHGVEHWCQLTGRRVDDLQDLSGRGLLLQRLMTLGFGRVTLSFALGKFSLTLGKLTFEIGYAPFGIG